MSQLGAFVPCSQFSGSIATRIAQFIITSRNASVSEDVLLGPPSDQDKSTLLANINSALNGINNVVDADVFFFE